MPIVNLHYGHRVSKNGRRVYQSLLLCLTCNKTRVVNRDSVRSNCAGIDYCYQCSRVHLSERNKKKIWTEEMKNKSRQKRLGDKNYIWNPDRNEILLKYRFRNKSYHLIAQAINTPNHTKTINNTIKRLGYRPQDLRSKLESTWEPWMNWDNYGKPKFKNQRVWTVDHIEGLEKFYYLGINDLKTINALTNLRALDASKNVGYPSRSKMLKKHLQEMSKKFSIDYSTIV